MATMHQSSTLEADDGARAAIDLSAWTRRVGESLEQADVPDRARLLFARAERGMARGLRVAATQLDHVAFRLDCAGRKLEARSGAERQAEPAPKRGPLSAPESGAAGSMDDELLSPHLA